jgi:hypothetical protein
MKKIFLIFLLLVNCFSCSKEGCKWEYDNKLDKFVYNCYYVNKPIQYPQIVSGSYLADSNIIQYVPGFKYTPWYDELINKTFKNYAPIVESISLSKNVSASYDVQIYGLPMVGTIIGTLSDKGTISFENIKSDFQFPMSFSVAPCGNGIRLNGYINTINGKPAYVHLVYSCPDEDIVIYSFNLK